MNRPHVFLTMPRSSAKLNMGVARAFFQTATEPGRMSPILDVLTAPGCLTEPGRSTADKLLAARRTVKDLPIGVRDLMRDILFNPVRDVEVLSRATQAAHELNGLDITRADKVSSALCENFNTLWALALTSRNGRRPPTHFAMQHDDIEPASHRPGTDPPEPLFWLDILMDEMRRTGADVISAVSPIKDPVGTTSTAVGDPNNAWDNRRLMVKEVAPPIVMDESGNPVGEAGEADRPRLPETFGIEELVEWDPTLEGKCLLMNTGLWLADLSKPWVNDVCFETCQRMTIGEDGARHSWFAAEDWLFARHLHHWGLKVMATTKVPLIHWSDAAPWPCPGEWGGDTDGVYSTFAAGAASAAEQPECIRRLTPEPV